MVQAQELKLHSAGDANGGDTIASLATTVTDCNEGNSHILLFCHLSQTMKKFLELYAKR